MCDLPHGFSHLAHLPKHPLLSASLITAPADLGSCHGLFTKPPYTEYISTRWYRAPECLLTDGYYGYKMDIWGVGCVFFEILTRKPLFPGADEMDQIDVIHSVLGTPDQAVLDKYRKYDVPLAGGSPFCYFFYIFVCVVVVTIFRRVSELTIRVGMPHYVPTAYLFF